MRLPMLMLLLVEVGTAAQDAVAEAAQGTALARNGKYEPAIRHCRAAQQPAPPLIQLPRRPHP